MSENTKSTLDIRALFILARRRKLLLLIPWSVAMLGAVLAAVMLKPVYFSTVTMVMERGQQLGGRLGEMLPGDGGAAAQADIMREQVASSVFLRSVITASGILKDPETRSWALENAPRQPDRSPDDAAEAFMVAYLQDAVSVRRGRGVIEITVADFEPARAQRVASAVAEQFVLSSKAAQLEALRATQKFTLEQQQVYKQRLEDSERRLEEARRSALSSDLTGTTVNADNVARARTLLEQARIEATEQQNRVGTLRASLKGQIQENDPQLLSDATVTSTITQLAALERQLAAAMLDGSNENESTVRSLLVRKSAELEAELSSNAALNLPSLSVETRQLLVRYRLADADAGARRARVDYLESQLSAYERQVILTPDRELEIQRLQQQVDNDRLLYNSFLQQSSAAQIAEAFENAKVSGRFSVLEPANLPLQPGKPNRVLLIVLGFLAGGVMGIGSVLLVEHQDQSVKDADEVESLLGLPVLGVIPRVEELDRSRRKSRSAPATAPGLPKPEDQGLLHRLKVESPLGLEFRRIFLRLAKSHTRPLPRTIMITSATRGEGKTTTSASLAITLARELHEKMLLVDFDLRSPKLHRALGLPMSSWGLAQMLQQRHFDERFVRSTVIPELDFLGAGKSERPAAELLDSHSVEWFLEEARARYPLVLVDAAPNLAVPDPLIIGRAVEGVIYVIRAGSTIRKAAEYGVKVQREACDNVLGVLMNDLGEILAQYYGYRYKAYGYGDEVVGGDS